MEMSRSRGLGETNTIMIHIWPLQLMNVNLRKKFQEQQQQPEPFIWHKVSKYTDIQPENEIILLGSQKVTVDWTTTAFLIGQLVFFLKSQDISLTLQFARLPIEDLQLHREAQWFITRETLVISLINKSTPEIWWRHRSMQSTLFPSIMLVLPQSEVRANGGVYLKPPTCTQAHTKAIITG